jgi:biofilm PGA synthesis lipoprotein PgaB
VLTDPGSEEWYAQNFSQSIKAYDYTVIMAYPLMEEINNPIAWLTSLVKETKRYPGAIEKTVFKVQTYDWKKERWINTKTINKWLRTLLAQGALHIGYYPDNFIENEPNERQIRLIMSTEDFPFKRKLTVKDLTLVQ